MTMRATARLRLDVSQVGRFGVVGLANTAIDFAVTNAIALLVAPRDALTLTLISITACAAASANSYVLNRRWTFRDFAPNADRGTLVRFLGMVVLGLLINTSVFLFCHRYFQGVFNIPDLPALNLAKLAGVLTAMGVSFIGYRFGVFRNARILGFREAFRFDLAPDPIGVRGVLMLACVATAVRGVYLLLTTAVAGDAVNYSWVAQGLASRHYADIDTFWSSLYCFWQACFHAAGLGPAAATITASFIPGVLLVVVVAGLAQLLYGPTAAWIAGGLCCVHPRLVEYSCNGYAESFYLLAFTCGITCLTANIQRRSLLTAAGWGAAFGIYACVRNEALVAFVLSLALAMPVRGNAESIRQRLRRAASSAGLAVVAFACMIAAYAGASRATLGTPGIFQKGSNLGKQFSEQLDAHEAARETYAGNGRVYGTARTEYSLSQKAATLIRRYPRNVYYTLQRLPAVLLSPLPLFALLLPMFAARRGRVRGDERPLAMMMAFPVIFYPCIQVEPRLLFPMLIPLHVFGAAGLLAASAYWASAERPGRLLKPAVAAFAVIGLGLASWRGIQVEGNHRLHRELAGWLNSHTAPGETLVGCGYGHVTNTAFLAGRAARPRVWTSDPADLADFVAGRHSRWLVLYEAFLREANPELLPALERGVPGFDRVHEARDNHGLRAQVLKLARTG